MEAIIEKKIEYYKKQQESAIKRYLNSCKRVDRDIILRITERIQVYRELMKEKV